MEKEILATLKEEIKKMEVQIIIQKKMLDVINRLSVPGNHVEEFTKQKEFLMSTLEMNKLVLVELKELISKEEGQ